MFQVLSSDLDSLVDIPALSLRPLNGCGGQLMLMSLLETGTDPGAIDNHFLWHHIWLRKQHWYSSRRELGLVSTSTGQDNLLSTLEHTMDPKDSARAQVIGLISNCGLFGTLAAQIYTYHTSFPSDPLTQKILVYTVFVLETIQTILVAYDRYVALVLGFGDALAQDVIGLGWFCVPVLSGIFGGIAQVFYAHRIYKFSKSKTLCVVILMLSVVQTCAAIVEGAQARKAEYLFQLKSPKVFVVVSIWLLSTVICDVLIAISMTCILLKFKRDFHHAPSIFSKLISLTVETGTATATTAVLLGVLFVTQPGNRLFDIPGNMLGKLYSNSLMRVLNSRAKATNWNREPLSTARPEITTLPISYDRETLSS